MDASAMQEIVAMGFTEDQATIALLQSDGDLGRAINLLLEQPQVQPPPPSQPARPRPPRTAEIEAEAALQRALEESRLEAERAARAARGSRGGATCAERVRKGMLFLRRACRLDVDAEDELVEDAARPEDAGQDARPRSHAASLPLCVQLQLETLADGPE